MSKFNVARGLSDQRDPPTSNFSFNAALRQAICLAPQNFSPRGSAVRCVGVALSQGKFSPGIIWEFFNLGFDHIRIDANLSSWGSRSRNDFPPGKTLYTLTTFAPFPLCPSPFPPGKTPTLTTLKIFCKRSGCAVRCVAFVPGFFFPPRG